MFRDARGAKVILVSHCVLNQNSISDGTADYPAAIKEVVYLLIEAGILCRCRALSLPAWGWIEGTFMVVSVLWLWKIRGFAMLCRCLL